MNQTRTSLLVMAIFIAALLAGIARSPSQASVIDNDSRAELPQVVTGYQLDLPLIQIRTPIQTAYGIELHNLSSSGRIGDTKAAGASWTRRNSLLWSNVEPTEGTYEWSSSFDQELKNASQSGLQTILTVRSTPEWAQKYEGVFCGPPSEEKLQAFGDFMYQAVKRYSTPPYNILYWQIWNEPDVHPESMWPYGVPGNSVYGCLGNAADSRFYGGGYYAKMLEAAYPRMKEANPNVQVVIGGLLLACKIDVGCTKQSDGSQFQGQNYLEGILDNNGKKDGKNYFDIVAFHAYDDYWDYGIYGNGGWGGLSTENGPVIALKAGFLRSVLEKYGAADKPLITTELALRCGPGADAPSCSDQDPNSNFAKTKAYYIAEAYATGIASGLKAVIWYDFDGGWRNTALTDDKGNLMPAYYAFQASRRILQDARFSKNLEFQGLKGYEFTRGNRTIWILWSMDGNLHPAELTYGLPDKAYDHLETPVDVTTTTIDVGLVPIYLEWKR